MNNFFVFILTFAVGVFLADKFQFGFLFGLGLLFLGLVFLFYHYFYREVFYFLLFFGFLGLALGVGRFELAHYFRDRQLDAYLGRKVVFTGIVKVSPDEREEVVKVIIEPENTRARVSLWLGRENKISYGDLVRVSGTLLREKYSDNYQLNQAKIEAIEILSGDRSLRSWLFYLKKSFLENFRWVIPEPASGLLAGLVVGEKHGLSKTWQERFRATGLSHIVVLSGYNLTLVADSLLKILNFLPHVFRYGAGALGIILFTLLTGAEAATVRAAIMALVVLLAKLTGREYQATIALFTAGFLMLFYEPSLLTSNPGFQLSFLATFGLIQFSPLIDKILLRFLPTAQKFSAWREIAVNTLAVQIFILPWALYKFGTWSLVALPANLLILPTIPLTMFLGFLAGLFGFFHYLIAWPFGALAYLVLNYQLMITNFFASFSGASVAVGDFSIWLVIGSYLVYGYIILWHNHRSRSSLPVGQESV